MGQSLESLLVDDPVGALGLEGAVHELHLRLRELGLLGHRVHITGFVPAIPSTLQRLNCCFFTSGA